MGRTEILSQPAYLAIALAIIKAEEHKERPSVDYITGYLGDNKNNVIKKLVITTIGKTENRFSLFTKQKIPKQERNKPGRAKDFYLINWPAWTKLFAQEVIESVFEEHLARETYSVSKKEAKVYFKERLETMRKNYTLLEQELRTAMKIVLVDFTELDKTTQIIDTLNNQYSVREFLKLTRAGIVKANESSIDFKRFPYWEACMLAEHIENKNRDVFIEKITELLLNKDTDKSARRKK